MVEWICSHEPVPYRQAVSWMENRTACIASGSGNETVWLLEHPPLYSSGTSTQAGEIPDDAPFPVFSTGRGGRVTYHGPGQRVAYLMLDLNRRRRDVRLFVSAIEQWIIAALAEFDVHGFPAAGRTGVWVRTGNGENKIAAIGIRLRRWISFHGVALNVRPNLRHFDPIVPCGIRNHGVTSLSELSVQAEMPDVDTALRRQFERFLGEAAWNGTELPPKLG